MVEALQSEFLGITTLTAIGLKKIKATAMAVNQVVPRTLTVRPEYYFRMGSFLFVKTLRQRMRPKIIEI